jgi:hypothetical protein
MTATVQFFASTDSDIAHTASRKNLIAVRAGVPGKYNMMKRIVGCSFQCSDDRALPVGNTTDTQCSARVAASDTADVAQYFYFDSALPEKTNAAESERYRI